MKAAAPPPSFRWASAAVLLLAGGAVLAAFALSNAAWNGAARQLDAEKLRSRADLAAKLVRLEEFSLFSVWPIPTY